MQISRANTVPGSHPKIVNKKTSIMAPHPLSHTASGGKIMQSRYRINIVTKSAAETFTLLTFHLQSD